jgi:predicted nucleic acid-binding protein
MSFFIDTSVLVAAMIESEDFHEPCRAVVVKGEANMYSHGITETFSTLTGGKKTFRLSAAVAAEFLDDHFVPRLTISTLTPTEILRAMREAETRGKAKAARFYTLNIAHFRAFHRSGDPEIAHP